MIEFINTHYVMGFFLITISIILGFALVAVVITEITSIIKEIVAGHYATSAIKENKENVN